MAKNAKRSEAGTPWPSLAEAQLQVGEVVLNLSCLSPDQLKRYERMLLRLATADREHYILVVFSDGDPNYWKAPIHDAVVALYIKDKGLIKEAHMPLILFMRIAGIEPSEVYYGDIDGMVQVVEHRDFSKLHLNVKMDLLPTSRSGKWSPNFWTPPYHLETEQRNAQIRASRWASHERPARRSA